MRIEPHHIGTSVYTPSSRHGGAESATHARPVGEQLQQTLFQRPRPRLSDPSAQTALTALLVVLNRYRRKLAVMAGDREDDYGIVLADDTIAAIDAHGTIYMGLAFLRLHAHSIETLVGALAHEIGHRPKRLAALKSSLARDLTQREVHALCLHEEIRADTFAGHGLAEMNMRWEPLADFIAHVQVHPHPQYLPAAQRREVLRQAHTARLYRASARRKLFPQMDRHTSANLHLGEF